MKFRTEIKVEKAPFSLSPVGKTVFMGSCFSDNIGGRLADYMAPVSVNPCGVQFNPASIARVISLALEGKELSEDAFFLYDGLWRCWFLPTSFASAERVKTVEKAKSALGELRDDLRDAQVLVVTFGTAQVYRHLPSQHSLFEGIVSNCHKVPAREFSHEMLSVSDIVGQWLPLMLQLREFNPLLKVIFTVSPVRHLNPSPHLNTLSKATLQLAVDQLITDSADVVYFPAWELLMDDLRDYRFYADDLVHPSSVAVDYIWEKFCDTFYSETDRRILADGASRSRRLRHRPLLQK